MVRDMMCHQRGYRGPDGEDERGPEMGRAPVPKGGWEVKE